MAGRRHNRSTKHSKKRRRRQRPTASRRHKRVTGNYSTRYDTRHRKAGGDRDRKRPGPNTFDRDC